MDINKINLSLARANDAFEGMMLASFGTLLDEATFNDMFATIDEDVDEDVDEATQAERDFTSYVASIVAARVDAKGETVEQAIEAVERVASSLAEKKELPPMPDTRVATDEDLNLWLAVARGVGLEERSVGAEVVTHAGGQEAGPPPRPFGEGARLPGWWPDSSELSGSDADLVRFVEEFLMFLDARIDRPKFDENFGDGEEVFYGQIGGGWRRDGLDFGISKGPGGTPKLTAYLSERLMANLPRGVRVVNNEVEFDGYDGRKAARFVDDLVR